MSEQSNEEIRVKVARLMGYRWLQMRYCGRSECPEDKWVRLRFTDQPAGFFKDFDNIHEVEGSRVIPPLQREMVPNYPEDPAAALTLCDRLREEGWLVNMMNNDHGNWRVSFVRNGVWGVVENCNSLPRAICLAFLKAHPSP